LSQRREVEALFAQYVEHHVLLGEPPALEKLCRATPELLEPLRELVAEYQRVELALEAPSPDPAVAWPSPPTIARYRVLERLASGGMGVVYRAEDPDLGRHVALKLPAPAAESWDESARERFRREARAASGLDHPNICTIYEVGETTEGQPFLAMALYEGETVAARIAGGPLPLDEALDIALQTADGLACAHARGIVHRDIKPANLLVTGDGVVKILDFGLAKRAGEAGLTASGARLGTAAYMAPEQVRGGEVDARADVWACGAVLHEMLTGQKPFSGETPEAVLYRIVHEEPEGQELLPEPLREIVLRALSKDPAARPADAGAWRTALREARARGRSRRPVAAGRRRLAAVAVLVAAGALLLWGSATERLWPLAPRARGIESPRPLPSVAVLPLANLGPPGHQYFADGMTEALITQLAKIEALKVMSRSAVMRYGTDRPPPSSIARELGVAMLVEGSVLLAGERVRITAQLVDGATDRPTWAESYEGDVRDILALQGRVASAIAREIRVRVTPEEARRITAARPVGPEAYDRFLEGSYHIHRALEMGEDMFASLDSALEALAGAVELEPEWAEAIGRLARVHAIKAEMSDDVATRTEHEARADELSQRALELDPEQINALVVRSRVLLSALDWEGAERVHERLQRIDAQSNAWNLSLFLRLAGRYDEALERMRTAQARDPTNALYRYEIGRTLICKGDFGRAAVEAASLRSRFGDTLHATLLEAEIASRQGRYLEAIDLLEPQREALMVNRATTYSRLFAYAAAKAGQPERARQVWQELQARGGPPEPPFLLLALGDPEGARRAMEEAHEMRSAWLRLVGCWPDLDELRRLPGVDQILREVGPPTRP
jgi:eukaryotic-like serine/threonine-protein kinase